MIRIAITGGIACGKSTVGRFLRRRGVATLDADEVGHTLLKRGQDACVKTLAAFGDGILGEDGEIHRAKLAARVFADMDALAILNGILHPEIRRVMVEWLRGQEGPAAAGIVPLLHEAGWCGDWDFVVCVVATEEIQRYRLLQRGCTRERVERILASQWASEKKAEQSDVVIVNNGSIESLEEQTERMLNCILER